MNTGRARVAGTTDPRPDCDGGAAPETLYHANEGGGTRLRYRWEPAVRLVRGHLLAVGIVVAAVTAVGTFFAVARPTYEREVQPGPPDHGLPYTVVSYTAADARSAFAAEGIVLTPRLRSAIVTSLGHDVLEVSAFASREKVERSGFYNYTQVDGEYAPFPKSCEGRARSAARWRGNVRVVVACSAAGDDAAAWLRRVDRALARL